MTYLDLAQPAQFSLALGPDLLLMAGAMLLLLWAAWRPDSAAHQRRIGVGALVLCAVTLASVVWYMGRYGTNSVGPIAIDNFRWMMDIIILVGTMFTIGLSMDDHAREGVHAGESHVLVLLASAGMMLLVGARDLMILFLGIELMSISVYALAGLNRRSARAAEGALKYFLLGAFSTAFLLYGIALIYGATGTTNLPQIGVAIEIYSLSGSPLVLIGTALLLVGFGFKVATVPFHMWAPDVYDGATSSITAYMAATVKAAAFAGFVRLWLEAFPGGFEHWHGAVQGLAIATMIVGNAVGLAQKNMKRMLAYSSIGHAGYLLVGVAAGTLYASTAILFYLFIYTLATFGAFAVLVTVARPGRGTVMIDELAGLWSARPSLALGMGVIMLSLLGFPLFGGAGFFAKWYVLQAALTAPVPQTVLAVVLVLTTVISAGYYLYVVMVMFMRPRPADAPPIRSAGQMTGTILAITVGLILALGILPDWAVRYAGAGMPLLGTRPPPAASAPAPGVTSLLTAPAAAPR